MWDTGFIYLGNGLNDMKGVCSACSVWWLRPMIKLCFVGQVPVQVPEKTLGASRDARFSKCHSPPRARSRTSLQWDKAAQLEERNLHTITRKWDEPRTQGGPFPSQPLCPQEAPVEVWVCLNSCFQASSLLKRRALGGAGRLHLFNTVFVANLYLFFKMLYKDAAKYYRSERQLFKRWWGDLLRRPKDILKNDNVSQIQKSNELNLLQ